MSRIARQPIPLPKGVDVTLGGGAISVKGPLGAVSRRLDASVEVRLADGAIRCQPADGSRRARAMSGTVRALIANMVTGVTRGFERRLTLVGVGYRAQAQGDALTLSLGFSHPVQRRMPPGVKVSTPTQTEVVLTGIDKQLVGQVAAQIRDLKRPEPYKGKGVRYADERVVLKETKKK